MASQTPVFIHNENLHIHGGKGAGELKSGLARTKSVKPGLQERKALRDLSNAKQTQAPGPSKAAAAIPKEKSALKSCASKVKKAVVKGSALTEQQLEKCREWAKEGIEYAGFTGSDTQKLEEKQREERVRREVEMVMSAMRDLTATAYDLRMPKIAEDTEDDLKLEFEPEILLPTITYGLKSRIEDDIDDLLEADLDEGFFPFPDITCEYTMKEEYD